MIKSSDSTQLLSVQSVAIVLKQITLFSAHRGIIFIDQTLLSLIVICHTLISRCMINYFVLKRFNSRYNTMRQKIIKLSFEIRGTGLKHILSSEKNTSWLWNDTVFFCIQQLSFMRSKLTYSIYFFKEK